MESSSLLKDGTATRGRFFRPDFGGDCFSCAIIVDLVASTERQPSNRKPLFPIMRLFRQPIFHFLLGGGMLFLVRAWFTVVPSDAIAEPVRTPVVISMARVEALRLEHKSLTGRLPSAQEEQVMIRRVVDDELLLHEARMLGLDRSDRSVRHRLVQKMGFLSDRPDATEEELYREAIELGLDRDDIVLRRMLVEKMRLLSSLPKAGSSPSEAELHEYLERHADRYRQPARVSLSHVFFARSQRGDAVATAMARDLRRAVAREGLAVDVAVDRGDSFPLGHRFSSSSEQDLAKIFGSAFASAAMELNAETWSQPIPSAFGVHLVFASTVTPSVVPALDAVRSRVLRALEAERSAERYQSFLADLREKYEVRVERPS